MPASVRRVLIGTGADANEVSTERRVRDFESAHGLGRLRCWPTCEKAEGPSWTQPAHEPGDPGVDCLRVHVMRRVFLDEQLQPVGRIRGGVQRLCTAHRQTYAGD